MKIPSNYLIYLLLLFMLNSQSCKITKSTSVIEPERTFVLGEGNHDDFKIKVTNEGTSDLELFTTDNAGNVKLLTPVKPKQTCKHKIEENTSLNLKNLSPTEKAKVNLKIKGETNLKMEYKNN